MIRLVAGGSKSGKSAYGERLLESFKGQKVYIATMEPYGEDAERAIERHRAMRAGKGFVTLERYRDIGGAQIPEGAGVLIECMGNLLANEMFTEDGICCPTEKILSGIEELSRRAGELIIVTNLLDGDGRTYGEGTELYIRYMGEMNRRLGAMAQSVTECVFGIPIAVKGELL
ncbi:MAG: bifunctional adenosylcobinamide kinase/adenosylcobinamide-phosphate guanylyltransferase [Ruminococcus sp.]|nr:bifunctional adenosylcobinamide kinase/adenosylcobinamide-phosphate guanylyltransferase [Ruminococcus sp.]